MKNNLFIFGDSFSTKMLQIKKLINFYDEIKQNWFEIVSDNLDLELSIYGIGGSSNEEIINNFYTNFHQIHKNDVVIIGSTVLTRIMGFDENQKKVTTLNNDFYFPKINAYSSEYSRELIKGRREFEEKNKNLRQLNLIDYINDNIIAYENYWIDYYRKIYENIISLCREKEAECYFWSSDYWQSFTTLSIEINYEVIDSHWGPIGNENFATYMLYRIENKDYYNKIKPWDINRNLYQ